MSEKMPYKNSTFQQLPERIYLLVIFQGRNIVEATVTEVTT
jgi:hypothetical protein